MSDDYYYKQAKIKGYRSRASYKLLEINKKFNIFKTGQFVVDLGAAPGGWSQVAARKIGKTGKVVAIDKAYIQAFKESNIVVMRQDILNEDLEKEILENYGKFDVLISDCAPNISGNYGLDHNIQTMLAERALNISEEILKAGGCYICKLFQGSETEQLVKRTRELFGRVKLFKPQSSRKKSSEIYLVATGFDTEI